MSKVIESAIIEVTVVAEDQPGKLGLVVIDACLLEELCAELYPKYGMEPDADNMIKAKPEFLAELSQRFLGMGVSGATPAVMREAWQGLPEILERVQKKTSELQTSAEPTDSTVAIAAGSNC